MGNRNEKIEELLNGYLDGVLSAQELSDFHALIESEPGMSEQLESLRSIRNAILAIPSRRLPGNFADRVLQGAAERAAAMESPPAWIRPTVQLADKTELSMRVKNRDRVQAWTMIFGSLAALFLVAFLGTRFLGQRETIGKSVGKSEPKISTLVPAIPGEDDPSTKTIEGTNNPEVPAGTHIDPSLIAANPVNNAGQDRDAISDVPNSVTPNSVTPNSPNSMPPNSVNDDAPNAKSIASNRDVVPEVANLPEVANTNGAKTPGTDTMVAVEPQKFDEVEKKYGQELERQMAGGFRIFMVCDVTLSKQALEEKTLEGIFDQNDIPFESSVLVDQSMRDQLARGRFVGPQDGQGELQSDVALVFVKARGNRLDHAILQVRESVALFPEFSLDLTVDPPALEVLDSLQSIQEFEASDFSQAPESGPQGVARSLARTHANVKGIAIDFPKAKRRTLAAPQDERSGRVGAGVGDPSMNPVEYCLFIVRTSPE